LLPELLPMSSHQLASLRMLRPEENEANRQEVNIPLPNALVETAKDIPKIVEKVLEALYDESDNEVEMEEVQEDMQEQGDSTVGM